MQSILVCDDDKQIVEAIDIYLTGEGFEVIKAYDGAEALELLKTHTVNLMILDVMMPGLDGIRTTLTFPENLLESELFGYEEGSLFFPRSLRMRTRFWA